MAKKPESRLQLRGHKAIMAKYGRRAWGFKVHGNTFVVGIPDRIYSIDGYLVAIEWKHPDERRETTALQLHNIRLINRTKGLAFVAKSIPYALRRIKEFLKEKAAQDKAVQVPARRAPLRHGKKVRRIVHGARNWKDTRRTVGNGNPVRRKRA